MFTGIVEEVGVIKKLERISPQAVELTVAATKVISDVSVGDSISVNGICLTVTSFSAEDFVMDVMPETIQATSLNTLEVGSQVNLERSMPANGRFGGHFVSGHIDGIGHIVTKTSEENAIYYEIKLPKEFTKFILMKGSIAVDGISLTVFGRSDDSFTISLIPHTVTETILGAKGVGDIVNIEYDMFAKYVDQMFEQQDN